MTVRKTMELISARKARSAWGTGVISYALELLGTIAENNGDEYELTGCPADRNDILNGAQDWNQYSWGGCSYIYDEDIAKALCTPSELKRTDNGRLPPNRNEQWLDTQARALSQAASLIWRTVKA